MGGKSIDIREYFNPKHKEKVLDSLYAEKSSLLLSSEDALQMLISHMDFDVCYHITITSKSHYMNNDGIASLVKLKMGFATKFSYVLYPAYQDRMVLHYHGFLWFHSYSRAGRKMVGLTASKALQTWLTEQIGLTKIRHLRTTCRTKVLKPEWEMEKIRRYIFSEDNYLGCQQYKVIVGVSKSLLDKIFPPK